MYVLNYNLHVNSFYFLWDTIFCSPDTDIGTICRSLCRNYMLILALRLFDTYLNTAIALYSIHVEPRCSPLRVHWLIVFNDMNELLYGVKKFWSKVRYLWCEVVKHNWYNLQLKHHKTNNEMWDVVFIVYYPCKDTSFYIRINK